ncbi:MAG TPA: squalene synthase HpnC [Motilibacteraceae bacterium]|nr:squalene synthase HpnC [Motilibacteraceae bacterium]
MTAAAPPSLRRARQRREIRRTGRSGRWTSLEPTTSPDGAAREDELRALEAAENFPVALRLLPAAHRHHLQVVYDVARTIDDLGDAAAGDPASRTADLLAFAADLRTVWRPGAGPEHPVLRRLVPTVRACLLDAEPFERLIEANLQDQRKSRYATFSELRDYCVLSADPVGRIVLQVFGQSTPARQVLSDRVCTALQVLEHLQDVAEDRARGRVYLPQEDLAAFGVTVSDLDAASSSTALAALVRWETERAARLLEEGAPLVAELRGWGRLAVAGFLAGGLATVDALLRPGVDVLVATPRPRRADVGRHAITVLTRSLRSVLFVVSGTGMSDGNGPRRRS